MLGVPQKIKQKHRLIYTTEDDGRGRPLVKGRRDEGRGAAAELRASLRAYATGVGVAT